MNGCRSITTAAVTAAALALTAPVANAQERGPLALASMSYFFVGGRIDSAVEGSPTVGQMYVEAMIPARRNHPNEVAITHRRLGHKLLLASCWAVEVRDNEIRQASAKRARRQGRKRCRGHG